MNTLVGRCGISSKFCLCIWPLKRTGLENHLQLNSTLPGPAKPKFSSLKVLCFHWLQELCICPFLCLEHFQAHFLLPALGGLTCSHPLCLVHTTSSGSPSQTLLWMQKDQSRWLITTQFMFTLRTTTVPDKLTVLVHSHSNKMLQVKNLNTTFPEIWLCC